jgi:hypothetical protein
VSYSGEPSSEPFVFAEWHLCDVAQWAVRLRSVTRPHHVSSNSRIECATVTGQTRHFVSLIGIGASTLAVAVAVSSTLFGFLQVKAPPTQTTSPPIERIIEKPPPPHKSRHPIHPHQRTGAVPAEIVALEAQSQHNTQETAHLGSSLTEVRDILLDNPRAAVSYTLLKREVQDNKEKADITVAALQSRLDEENEKLEWIVGVLGLGFAGLIASVVVGKK